MTDQNDSEVPQNPYRNFTEDELNVILRQNEAEFKIIEKQILQKAAQKIVARNSAFLERNYALRNGVFSLRHTIEQIAEVLQEHAENAETTDNDLMQKMRKTCARLDKRVAASLEVVKETINDYRYAFPNEKTNILKKFGQVGSIVAFTTAAARLFFPDNATAQYIATGSALAVGTALATTDFSHREKEPSRKRGLEPYEIRQVYCYLA